VTYKSNLNVIYLKRKIKIQSYSITLFSPIIKMLYKCIICVNVLVQLFVLCDVICVNHMTT